MRKESALYKGKMSNAIARVAEYLGDCEVSEIEAERESLGYTNCVFRVRYQGVEYIYKEYSRGEEGQKNLEMKWQHFFKFPETLYEAPTYRIDRYVEHTKVTAERARTPEFLRAFVRELVKIHTHPFDRDKEKNTYFDTMRKLRGAIEGVVQDKAFSRICAKIEKKLGSIMDASAFKERQVICHNDLQMGNILLQKNNRVQFIDYEYTSINYPSIDIANFLCELMTDYETEAVLNRERRLDRRSLEMLLGEYIKQTDIDLGVDELAEEVGKVEAVPHYYWFLWAAEALLVRKDTVEDLNYSLYGLNRLGFICESGIISDKEYSYVAEHILS